MSPQDYLRRMRLRAECAWLGACVTTMLRWVVLWGLWVVVPLLVVWLIVSAFTHDLGRP